MMPWSRSNSPIGSGWTRSGLGEHRFSRHGLLSGFFSFAGTVVARTQKVRIGTAVVVLPLHNPILVAEEVAMLDVLSGGRMEIGIGSGYQRQEFDGLGIDMNESRARFREATEVIEKGVDRGHADVPRSIYQRGQSVGAPEARAETSPPALCGYQHQSIHRRVGRQPAHSADPGWSHRYHGPGPAGAQDVA